MKKLTIIILVVLAVVGAFVLLPALGALSYFGVLDPSSMVVERCSPNPGFGCVDYEVSDEEVFFELQNANSVSITFDSFSAESEGISFGACSIPGELANRQTTVISCPVSSGSFSGVSEVDVSFTYTREDEAIPRSGSVRIITRQ